MNTMNTNFKAAIILILLNCYFVFGANISIHLDSGYCSGERWINNPEYQISSDSILFSSELSLNIVIPPHKQLLHSGTPCFDYYSIVHNNSFQNIVYKFNSAIFKKSGEWISTETSGNPDTIWNNALSFPDSMLLVDSIMDYYGISGTSWLFMAMGKWLFDNCGPDPDDRCYWIHMNENYNSIMYVLCNDNRKMKLQIDRCKKKEFSVHLKCNEAKYWIDSVHILWAADSAGNGIFKPSPTKAFNQRISNGINSLSSNLIQIKSMNEIIEFNLSSRNSPIRSLQIFDLRGSMLAKWQNPGRNVIWNSRAIPAGAYAASWVYGNRQTMSQRFVVKK